MTINEIVKAWRSPMFRSSDVPANPAGVVELTGTALDAVAGGKKGSGRSSRSSKSSRSRRHSSRRRRSSCKHVTPV
jgi:mersacidin/lichenicidin family type 2 lantibiotic